MNLFLIQLQIRNTYKTLEIINHYFKFIAYLMITPFLNYLNVNHSFQEV